MKNLLFLLVALLATTAAYAQQGAVSGTVYDEDGFPLGGANVVIQGTGTGGQADFIEGKYQFKADPGTYNIVASFLGYADVVFEDVVVEANETTILDVTFDPDAEGGVNLDDLNVEVVAKAVNRGEVALLKLRQNSDKVQDVISIQEISRSGASDVSAAMKSVTGTSIVDGKYVYVRGLGDRYSATTVNGLRLPSIDPYRNAAQLDLIPTSILDNIVANKTFTPDLPGDFTGGSINISLKELPELFTWGVSVSGGYNPQANLRDDFLSWNAGDRAGLGFNDGSLDRPEILDNPIVDELGLLDRDDARRARRDDDIAGFQEDVTDAFGNGFMQTFENTPLDWGVSANVGTQINLGNMPVGLFATASFKKDFSQYQGGERNNYFNPGGSDVLFRTFEYNEDRSTEEANLNGMLGFSLRPNASNTINFFTIYSHQGIIDARNLRGANDEFGVAGSASSFYQATTSQFIERELLDYVVEGTHVLAGLGGTKIEWAGNVIDSKQSEPDIRFLGYTEEDGFAQINQAQVPLPARYFRELDDLGYQGKVDITIPFASNRSRGNNFKIGGLYSTTERDFSELAYSFVNRSGESLNQVEADFGRYFADDNMGIIGGESGQNQIGLYVTDNSRLDNSYEAQTDIYAGYFMATYEFTDRFKAIAGLRAEGTQLYAESDIAEVSSRPEEFIADIDTLAFLPALNLVYRLTGDDNDPSVKVSNLRLSYTQTIARPNQREVAPFLSFGFFGDPPTVGNPNLVLTDIRNYDFRYELFPNAAEVIAFSAFYKQFDNPIVVTFRQGGDQQFTWTNSESASLYGLELEFRKKLSFISAKLQDFTVASNLSYIRSNQEIDEAEVRLGRDVDPEFETERQFNGQSPFIANVNLNWDGGQSDWNALVAFNYFGDRLVSIGAVGSPDIFERGRASLDLSVGRTLGNWKFSLRGRNLLNPDYERFSEFEGQTYTFSRYQRGREVSLGVSYSM